MSYELDYEYQFRADNTCGYTRADLARLNADLLRRVLASGLDLSDDSPGWLSGHNEQIIQHLREQAHQDWELRI